MVVAVSGDTLLLQGMTLPVAPDARFGTVTAEGSFADITFAQIVPGDPLRGVLEIAEGVPVLRHGFVGHEFFWHGVVTAVTADDQGALLGFELDGLITVHASQARVRPASAGHEGDPPADGDASDPGTGVPAILVPVGATVGVGGMAHGGIFAAAWVNVAAVTFVSQGEVSGLVRDAQDHLIGFTLTNRAGDAFSIVVDRQTVLWVGHRQVPPDTIREGARARVSGWVRPDGAILAKDIQLQLNQSRGGER